MWNVSSGYLPAYVANYSDLWCRYRGVSVRRRGRENCLCKMQMIHSGDDGGLNFNAVHSSGAAAGGCCCCSCTGQGCWRLINNNANVLNLPLFSYTRYTNGFALIAQGRDSYPVRFTVSIGAIELWSTHSLCGWWNGGYCNFWFNSAPAAVSAAKSEVSPHWTAIDQKKNVQLTIMG